MTGGAGFVGSHVVQGLLDEGYGVRVLEDLSSGSIDSLPSSADPVIGDAADTANVHATVAMLGAARRAGVRRVVYTSSSSLYGESDVLPTPESAPTIPRSDAVSKLAADQYCPVFYELYGWETGVLRYFNVFGPRQRSDSAFAAVIPLSSTRGREAMLPPSTEMASRPGTSAMCRMWSGPTLRQSRSWGPLQWKFYNVLGGKRRSLLELLEAVENLVGRRLMPRFTSPRSGDVHNSEADITAGGRDLGYFPVVGLHAGLRETIEWQTSLARAAGA